MYKPYLERTMMERLDYLCEQGEYYDDLYCELRDHIHKLERQIEEKNKFIDKILDALLSYDGTLRKEFKRD